jgi:hypothetical protein
MPLSPAGIAEPFMEEEKFSARPCSVAPFWLRVLVGGLVSLGVALQIWKHGFRNWDWVWSLLFLNIIFSDNLKGPLDKHVRWPLRLLLIIWVAACSAWFMHFWGWLPALAFAAIALVNPKQEKWLGWKAFLVRPQNIVVVLASLAFVIWFARDTGAWVPTFCVVTTFFLLERNTTARRSLIENLKRRSLLVVVCVAMIAGIWASLHPSFGNIAGFVAVIVLASSDVYLHTEEHQLVHP